MFFRRSLIDRHQHFFSDRYKAVGDADWVIRAIHKGIRMKVMRHYTSIFTETGDNLALRPHAQQEVREFAAAAPWWVRRSRPLISAAYRFNRMLHGGYREKPLSYSIYTKANPATRTTFQVQNPTPFWKREPTATELASSA